MFAALGRFAVHHKRAIVVVYAIALVVAGVLGAPVYKMLRVGGFEDPNAESWQVHDVLMEDMKIGAADVIAIYKNPRGNVDDVEMLSSIVDAIDRVEKTPDVLRVVSYYTSGAPQLVSKDRTSTFLVVSIAGDDQHRIEVYNTIKPILNLPAYGTEFGGVAPVNQVLYEMISEDLTHAEFLAFPLTAVLLLIIFGSGVSALLPLMVGGAAVALAFLSLRGILLFTDASLFAANIVSVLGLGLAIDYSLFIVNRFREELPKRGVEGAVERTIATTGRAVFFSGITVAASLCGLFAFPQMFLRSMAMGGIAVVVGAMMLVVTLLPAVLALLGNKVDAWRIPFGWSRAPENVEHGFWHTVAFAVMKRPVLVCVAVIVPLLVFAVPFLRIDPSFADHSILPKEVAARQAMERIDREFMPFITMPYDVLVTVPGDPMAPANLEALYELHVKLKAQPDVAVANDLFAGVDFVGKARWFEELRRDAKDRDPALNVLLQQTVHGSHVYFSLIPKHRFNTAPALAQVHALRAMAPPPGGTLQVSGFAAVLVDLKHVIQTRTPIMLVGVALVMFVVLFLVFGSITLPIKAIIMNSLSLTASFGAIVWIFQDGRFTRVLDYTPLGVSDFTQPLLMFAVVFGLSMDYEILLLSRVREEYLRTGDNALSVARGLARTGRLITSAAALLVVVIGAFATSKILFMKTIGVGIALAVALDATIIRALLVPAAMRLMGDWNWWAPAPLVRLWEKIGLSDLEGHDDEPPSTPPV